MADAASRSSESVSAALRRAAWLEYATIGWNVMEVFVTIGLGIAAGSLALVAFGLDSVVEVFASVAVLWDLRGHEGQRTQRALLIVAAAFFTLATMLMVSGVLNLLSGHQPDDSPFGIVYLGLTACVMFTLAWAKRRVSVETGNHPLAHESRVTFLDGMLATTILLALAANTLLGWWWADPLAAIVVALAAVFEGIAAPRQH